jgi:SAM-dependent methyltransferase
MNQCRKPSGLLGRLVLRLMNASHSKVTDWGLARAVVRPGDTILDVGCGGGRTVSKLAALAPEGKVYGIDHSSRAVAAATKLNDRVVRDGRVEIVEGSVSQLPFPNGMFDVVTAVETHFWWPDLPGDMREVFRVVKPGGLLVVIAEVYAAAKARASQLAEKYANRSGMKMLSVDQHREMLESAGFSNVEITTDSGRGWICCTGRKPEARG